MHTTSLIAKEICKREDCRIPLPTHRLLTGLVCLILLEISPAQALDYSNPFAASIFLNPFIPHYAAEFENEQWGRFGAAAGLRVYGVSYQNIFFLTPFRRYVANYTSIDLAYARALIGYRADRESFRRRANELGLAFNNRIDLNRLGLRINLALPMFGANPLPYFTDDQPLRLVVAIGPTLNWSTARSAEGQNYSSAFAGGIDLGLQADLKPNSRYSIGLLVDFNIIFTDDFDAVPDPALGAGAGSDAYWTAGISLAYHLREL